VKFGCSRNIVSFVLPIGYSFNLVGSMVYCSFAAMFIAQAYNVPLSFSEITVMMLTLMLASKIAGVPRSALVVLAATIPSFNIRFRDPAADGYRPFPRHGALRHQRVG
jgi:Na+/H+-dicarboxylate symporter